MGADERRASLRKVAEAIQLINEAKEHEQKRLGALFVEHELATIVEDATKSAQALEDVGNLTQAIALRDEWKWVTIMLKAMKEDIAWEEGFDKFFDQYKDKMPTFKRRMLKPDVVFNPTGRIDVPGPELQNVKPDPAIKLSEISIVETPPSPNIPRVQVLAKSEMVTLPRNISVKVKCKNPIKNATNKILDVKLFVMRGTQGMIVGIDKERGMAEVELLLDNDLWPDAERLSNRVMIPLKEFRNPVKEVPRGTDKARVQDESVGSNRPDEFAPSPSGNGAHADDNDN
jgi:hypothetical protein